MKVTHRKSALNLYSRGYVTSRWTNKGRGRHWLFPKKAQEVILGVLPNAKVTQVMHSRVPFVFVEDASFAGIPTIERGGNIRKALREAFGEGRLPRLILKTPEERERDEKNFRTPAKF